MRGLRWIAQPQGVYAQYRYKNPATGKWQSIGLGRIPTKDELEDFIADWSEEIHNATGENPVTLWSDLDSSLDRFREKADALNKRLRAGLDPKSEAGPEGITLRQALALHAQRMRNLGKSEATIAEYEWLAKRYLKDWLDVPLRKLTDAMVSKRHEAIGKRALKGHKGKGGPYAANKTMRLLRAVWNTARRKSEKTLGASTTDAVDAYKETRRQSAIPLAHLPTWFKEVEALRAKGRVAALRADLYLLGLLTGLRRRSLTTIEREHINRRVPDSIYIPKPKGGEDRAFDVPLSDAAKAIVERVLKSHNSNWLFPSDESKSGHIEDPRAQSGEFTPWKDAAGKKVAFTIHGLRASYISAAHAAGVSDRQAKLLANHAVHKSDVHGGYILAEADALREAQQRIADYRRQHGLPL